MTNLNIKDSLPLEYEIVNSVTDVCEMSLRILFILIEKISINSFHYLSNHFDLISNLSSIDISGNPDASSYFRNFFQNLSRIGELQCLNLNSIIFFIIKIAKLEKLIFQIYVMD